MSRLVTVYGGSGFVGRYITQRLARAGWRIRVAVRRPNEAFFVKPYGSVGQVEPVLCNIRDDDSVRAAAHGADAVVNCVGVLQPSGKNTFEAVHVDGAERIARIAAEQGAGRMVHLSALGADEQSDSVYSRTKAQGEAAVLDNMPGAMILRPSVVFGSEDEFFNRFAAMARLSLVLPVVGAATRFQPVYVDDVAAAAVRGAEGEAAPGIYELGGPDVDTLAGLMHRMLEVIERRRLVLPAPFLAGSAVALLCEAASAITLGVVSAPVTRDQIRLLRKDSVVGEGTRGLADLGISPTPMDAVLPDYLWPYRPAGQFAEIRDSARNLRVHEPHN